MDNKTLIQALLAMLVAMLLWIVAVKTFYAPPVSPPGGPDQPGVVSGPSEAPPEGMSSPPAEREPGVPSGEAAPAPAGAAAVTHPAEYEVVGATQPAPDGWIGDISGYRQGPFRTKIQGDSRGGSIRQVLLTDYMAQVTPAEDYELAAHQQLLRPATDPLSPEVEYLSMATESITLLSAAGQPTIDLGGVNWNMTVSAEDPAEQALRYDLAIRGNESPLLEIEKEFVLPAQSLESGRHDLLLSVRVRNVSPDPVQFTLVQDGPIGAPKEGKRMEERSVYSGTMGEAGVEVTRKKRRSLEEAHFDLSMGGRPLAWAGLANKFFMVLMAPAYDEGDVFGDLIARVEAFSLINERNDLDASRGLSFHFRTAPQTLHPGGDVVFKFACYLGPKARAGLAGNEDYLRRGYVAVLEKGYSGCTFVALAKLMVRLLVFFHGILLHNYGLAIIALVLIVRLILHPVTKKGQVNMVKMQEQMASLQPKLEEAKKKYANDKAKLNQATMEAYKEGGISPLGQLFTCLPMALQMPIWVALWTSLNYTVEMRHQPFCLWIRDLTGTDALNEWFGWHFEPFSIPLLSGMIGQVDAFNLLPIILSVTMYLQQRFMPKAASAHKRQARTPDQMAQQQKIMNVMMVFFGVLFYNAPAGLNLYILSSNVFGIIEQWRIRKHIAVAKEKGALAPSPPKPKESRKPGFFRKLERMAEDAKRVHSARQGKG